MTITEFAILPFKSLLDFTDPTLQSLFGKLSTWQSECSGFPLLFFTNGEQLLEVYLVTGWTSVAAHEAWIQGERNQELLRVFAPYVDIPRVRMVHIDIDFEAIPRDTGCTTNVTVIERYDGVDSGEMSFVKQGSEGYTWGLVGRDLTRDDGDVYRIVGVAEGGVGEGAGGVTPIERWILTRVEV